MGWKPNLETEKRVWVPGASLSTLLTLNQLYTAHFEKPGSRENWGIRGWKVSTGQKETMKIIKIIIAYIFSRFSWVPGTMLSTDFQKKKKERKKERKKEKQMVMAEAECGVGCLKNTWKRWYCIIHRQTTGKTLLKDLFLTAAIFSLHCSVGMDLSQVSQEKNE